MWRAFFYASGIMLIILGVECIVIGRFRVAPEAGFTKLAQKAWGNFDSSFASDDGEGRAFPNAQGPLRSQFGPSRFNNDPFFNASSNLAQSRENSFNLPNHTGVGGSQVGKKPKTITTEDWMPWSLIAAGAIISLYTRSLNRNTGDA